jgi:hypothetical protein
MSSDINQESPALAKLNAMAIQKWAGNPDVTFHEESQIHVELAEHGYLSDEERQNEYIVPRD